MCYTWQFPSKKENEIKAEHLSTLPDMVRLNITGGEPFLRDDITDILKIARKKAKRTVISSNGFLTNKIIDVMKQNKDIGIRISMDGIGETHDAIRGIKNAYQKSLSTIHGLKQIGIKDLGIAVTVSDKNANELVGLYNLAKKLDIELATAILHNAYYFHKEDNQIENKSNVEEEYSKLIECFLKSRKPKEWFRAYFTKGLIEHMYGKPRAMKCTMATDSFFIDPYGNVRPCNVLDLPFGNIKEDTFQEIWTSDQAENARKKVAVCQHNCWMIGSAGHLIRKKAWIPMMWILKNKIKIMKDNSITI
jgi:MoaA/NifB/PqqE/SkfB family radical SAM enzyme